MARIPTSGLGTLLCLLAASSAQAQAPGAAPPAPAAPEEAPGQATTGGPTEAPTEAPAAAPAPAPAEGAPGQEVAPQAARRLLVLDLDPGSVDEELVGILNGSIANALADRAGLNVITQTDLTQLLELEAQRQAVGCNDSSCLAEVAGAMGADFVLYGRAARVEALYVVQLNLFDAAQGRSVSRQEVKETSPVSLTDAVPLAVRRLVAPLTGEVGNDEGGADGPEAGGAAGPWVVGGGGAVAAGGVLLVALGAGLLAGGAAAFFLLDDTAQRELGQSAARASPVAAGVGAVLLVAGAAIAGVGLVLE